MTQIRGYILLLCSLGALATVNALSAPYISSLHDGFQTETTLVSIAIASIFVSAFFVFYTSAYTKIPTFILAVLFGLVSTNLLSPIADSPSVMTIFVGISATLILFAGGLEMPFKRFRAIAPHVLLLASIGVIVTAVLFGGALFELTRWQAIIMPAGIIALLAAILTSTDPTVLVPLMKELRFKSMRIKDIVIAESAVTDVTGALLAILLFEALPIDVHPSIAPLSLLAEVSALSSLLVHTLFGMVFGALGAGFLVLLAKFKTNDSKEHDVDAAFFFFVPIIIYALATVFGGSGLLAAFIAGLLFQTTQYLHETEVFFEHVIDGFIKPAIFILLGAMVPFNVLIEYAPIGVIAGLVFVFIIRPPAVLASLFPLIPFRNLRLSTKELLAVAAVRETGAIPAVLLVSMAAFPEIGSDAFFAIGMWVILLTLSFPPIILPWLYEKLGIATSIPDDVGVNGEIGTEPCVLLASRGGSFERRLPEVTEWAIKHDIHRVGILLCLEDKFSCNLLEEKIDRVKQLGANLKEELATDAKKIDYFHINTDGYLHDAIESLACQESPIVAMFVGKKMLDFHLEDIQKLPIPLYFID